MNNDDVVKPGQGFDTHPHRDMEIVTWVLRGSLVHQDSTGHSGVIYPGLAQRMSAGSGILHSEKNDSWTLTGDETHEEPVHFVQMWVVPDESGITPGYQQLEIDDELLRGGLVTIASGMPEHAGDAAITIRNRYAALRGARLQPGDSVELPHAPYLHLFVPRGEVTLEGRGPAGRRRRGQVHRLGWPARHRDGAIRDPGLGDACGYCCGVTPFERPWPSAWSASSWRDARRRLRLRPRRRRASATQPPAEAGLEEVTVAVPDDDLTAPPFDEPRKALVPKGWTMSVWHRLPKPRLAVWAPDGDMLVSVPSTGQVIRLAPTGAGPLDNLLLDGLDQPHGLAFAGTTLYVAESDQVDAYDYAERDRNATAAPSRPACRMHGAPTWVAHTLTP